MAVIVSLAPAMHAADRAKPYSETIPGTKVKIKMVPIPAGSAELLDPTKPGATRQVTVKPFWMSQTEVTWDALDVFVFLLDEKGPRNEDADAITRPTLPYVPPDFGFGHWGYPAIGVSFKMVNHFCKWLSAKTGRKYRLPTEVEWEYACRAGKPDVKKKDLAKVAWFRDNAGNKTHPAGKKQPNAWGLHDMYGNAAEWCTDLCDEPCVRGGSYCDGEDELGPAGRETETDPWSGSETYSPKSAWWRMGAPFVGFRIVREE
ncbi:MAG: SUMF1/EgtB/PvdO family nonheme iron enzyme [Verrucomicrobia bacterium]|nr:SUMF1/EgtB/PvdO family nonheme iron enzyme [Verrucomicrobiota bacterium]